MSIIKEFKEFALKSNFIDMATGIVIGGAVGTVVKSLVDDIIMPPIGYITGGVDFSALSLAIGSAPDGSEVAIKYGSFLNSVIAFLIIALAIFMIIKAVNTMKRRFEAEQVAAPPPEPPRQEVLLEEIRDLLKQR